MTRDQGQAEHQRFYWWIDGVGGYLVVPSEKVRIGQPGHDDVEVALLADLQPIHAVLHRSEGGTLLHGAGPTRVNGREVTAHLLKDGDRFELGPVEFQYRQPLPWCPTAILTVRSGHRFPLAVDGIVLLDRLCLLSPSAAAHIRAPWQEKVLVNWEHDRYWVSSDGSIQIDGQQYEGRGPLSPHAQVQADWGSFRWEPLD